MLNLEKRIALECGSRKPSEITELNLDNSKATEIVGLSEKYTCLRELTLNNVGLQSLKGFPALPSLERLELSNNQFTGGFDNLKNCPAIRVLNLSGNNLRDIDTLIPLAQLPALRILELYRCEVSKGENYRTQVFKTLPQLQYLDGFDCDNKQCPEEEEYGDEEDENGSSFEDEEDDFEEDDDDEEEEVGLDYLNRNDLEDDEDDFEPGADEEEDEDDEIDSEDDELIDVKRKGIKRKASADDRGQDNNYQRKEAKSSAAEAPAISSCNEDSNA